jgi:hypothetical protein
METEMDGKEEINVSRRTLLAGAAFASIIGAAVLTALPTNAEDVGRRHRTRPGPLGPARARR